MKREITLVECYQRAMREVESSRLTMAMRLAGNAMSPTLNFGVASGSVGEAVLVRKLVSARGRVFVGDVVAFRSPADSRALLVRRIAALEGHDMESSDPAEEGFRCATVSVFIVVLHVYAYTAHAPRTPACVTHIYTYMRGRLHVSSACVYTHASGAAPRMRCVVQCRG